MKDLQVFSVHSHGFCREPNTFYQEKHQHVHVDRHLVMGKEIRNKINFIKQCLHAWCSGIMPGCDTGEPSSILNFIT